MTTHPHASNQVAGSTHDRHLRTDVTGSVSSEIGKHFTPMVHNAPIHGLTTPHQVTQGPECFSSILFNGQPVTFTSQGCGSVNDGATLLGVGWVLVLFLQ